MKNAQTPGAGEESSSQMMQISQSESQSLMSSVDYAPADYEGNATMAGSETMGIHGSEQRKNGSV